MEYPDPRRPVVSQVFEACTALMTGHVAKLIKTHRDLDLNAATHHGKTLLTHCAAISSVSIMELLLDHGADPNLVDKDGDTPLECAVWSEREDLMILLLEHGANPDKSGKGFDHLLELAQDRAPDCLLALNKIKAQRNAEKLQESTPQTTGSNRQVRL